LEQNNKNKKTPGKLKYGGHLARDCSLFTETFFYRQNIA